MKKEILMSVFAVGLTLTATAQGNKESMKTKENERSMVPVVLLVLVIGGIAAGAYIYNRKRRHDSPSEKANDVAVNLDTLLEDLEVKYYKEYLGLYIYEEGRDHKLKVAELNTLKEKYGEYFSEPVVSWLDILDQLTNEQVGELTHSVKRYATNHGVDVSKSSLDFNRLFEDYLRQKAIKEAKEIVEAF